MVLRIYKLKDMIKIRNKFIPFKGFKAINILGVLFIRKGMVMYDWNYTHEAIHTEQMKELLFIPFYVWYVVEWIVRLIQYRNAKTAYKNISFEREAYDKQMNSVYPDYRKHYSFVKYLKQ